MEVKLFKRIMSLTILGIAICPIVAESAEYDAQTVAMQDNESLETNPWQDNGVDPDAYVPFSFKETKLADIVDFIAKTTNINVIYPQNPADSDQFLQQTITFRPSDPPRRIPLRDAWKMTRYFLDLAGFSVFKKKPKLFVIIKKGTKEEPGISRQPLSVYIDTKPEDLPDTTQYIRYIHYAKNLSVPKPEELQNNPIHQVITSLKSPAASDPIYLQKPNGFVLVDEAVRIASMITIINTLDQAGYQEVVKVLRLHNIAASEVVTVFDLLKAAAGKDESSPFIRRRTGSQSPGYWASETKIIADLRTNSVILMGRESALFLIEEFIINHMDVEQESGDSVLHYYDLQYLEAKNVAGVLNNLLAPLAGAQAVEEVGGPQRFFKGVVIEAEEAVAIKPPDALKSVDEITLIEGMRKPGITNEAFMGGNRLIIAAYQDDWERLEDILQKIDRREPQVILEVLIVDVALNRDKRLQAALRTKTPYNFTDNNIAALATHLATINNEYGPGTNGFPPSPTRIADDLLKLPSNRATSNNLSVPQLFPTGTTLLAINDCLTPGIVGLIAALDQYVDTRVLSHPYLVATNHQRATIANKVQKRVRGDALPSQSGVVTIRIDSIYATLQVQFIPHIVSENRLSLQVAVDVNEFIGETNDRMTRRVETNANMDTREVLVMGGLTRVRQEEVRTKTPILGDLPLVGVFFQGTQKRTVGSNLVVFISPTIVQTRFRAGLNLYTEDKLRKSRRDLSDHILYNHRDPVSKLYFPATRAANNDLIEEYLLQSKNAPTMEEIKTTRERLHEKQYPRFMKQQYYDPRKVKPKRRKTRPAVPPLVA